MVNCEIQRKTTLLASYWRRGDGQAGKSESITHALPRVICPYKNVHSNWRKYFWKRYNAAWPFRGDCSRGHAAPTAAMYSRITSTKSLSFSITIFSASLTNLTALPHQSHDCSYYVSRRILAPPPLWLQKHTDLRAHDFAHSPDMWHQPRLANVTCAWRWRLCGITTALQRYWAQLVNYMVPTTSGVVRFPAPGARNHSGCS
jgi:hypothetical protein